MTGKEFINMIAGLIVLVSFGILYIWYTFTNKPEDRKVTGEQFATMAALLIAIFTQFGGYQQKVDFIDEKNSRIEKIIDNLAGELGVVQVRTAAIAKPPIMERNIDNIYRPYRPVYDHLGANILDLPRGVLLTIQVRQKYYDDAVFRYEEARRAVVIDRDITKESNLALSLAAIRLSIIACEYREFLEGGAASACGNDIEHGAPPQTPG